VNTSLSKINGSYRLPPGYSFAILPRNTVVVPTPKKSSDKTTPVTTGIASIHSVLKILASIFQLWFAVFTLIRHQGDSIKRWGFASFFLVPVPYAIMSSVNGISNLLTPDYPSLYMVHSEIMDEAEQAGGAFHGIIGRVIPLQGPENDDGYGSSFDITWKGLSPNSIKRTLLKLTLLHLWRKRYETLTTTDTATVLVCTAPEPEEDVQNSRLLLEAQINGEVTRHSYIIDKNVKQRKDTLINSLAERRELSPRYGAIGIILWLISSMRHPHQTCATIRKSWNDFWSLESSTRKYQKLAEYFREFRQIPSITLLFALQLTTLKMIFLDKDKLWELRQKAVDVRPKISIQACSRFQRQDDSLICSPYGLHVASAICIQSACGPSMGQYIPFLTNPVTTENSR
jgi:hypothetical protein